MVYSLCGTWYIWFVGGVYIAVAKWLKIIIIFFFCPSWWNICGPVSLDQKEFVKEFLAKWCQSYTSHTFPLIATTCRLRQRHFYSTSQTINYMSNAICYYYYYYLVNNAICYTFVDYYLWFLFSCCNLCLAFMFCCCNRYTHFTFFHLQPFTQRMLILPKKAKNVNLKKIIIIKVVQTKNNFFFLS